jgi:hypothetical protein
LGDIGGEIRSRSSGFFWRPGLMRPRSSQAADPFFQSALKPRGYDRTTENVRLLTPGVLIDPQRESSGTFTEITRYAVDG